MIGFTVLITWVVNTSRGSVLLAMLFHASNNSAYDTLPGVLVPALFPPAVAAQAATPTVTIVGVVMAAVLVIVLTRGRLGYGGTASQAPAGAESSGFRGQTAPAVAGMAVSR
jgi:hypothetical protein